MSTPRRCARGASSVEYGLIIALIAAVIILAVVFFGESVSGLFDTAGSSVDDAINP